LINDEEKTKLERRLLKETLIKVDKHKERTKTHPIDQP
jgi:hypothetical protein